MGRRRTKIFSHVTVDSIDPQRFAHFQTKAHRVLCLLVGESHVAVTLLAGDFAAKPPWWLEFSTARVVRKFNFRHHQTMVAAVINVDLDLQFFPGNLVTRFPQSPAFCRRPKCSELFSAQSDFAFFSARPASAAHLEGKRHHFPLFPQANMPSAGSTNSSMPMRSKKRTTLRRASASRSCSRERYLR